jgi:hypothetical protein
VKKLAAMVILVALALTPLSADAQMNPRKRPTKIGPLTFDGDTYSGKNCQNGVFRRDGDTGQVTSKWTFCTFFYRYSTAQDNNSNRDFGAMWLATRVDPTNGWCAARVISKLGVQTSGSGRAFKRAPQGTTKETNQSRKVQTRLVVKANGGGDTKAVLKKGWILHPNNLKISRFQKDGFANLRLHHSGKTKKTVSFASAFEMSWPQGGNPPAISPELRALHMRNC